MSDLRDDPPPFGAVGRGLFGPMPAVRLTALRLGASIALFADLGLTYLPHTELLNRFGLAALGLGALAATALLFKLWPHVAAACCWLSVVGLWEANPLLHNGGDRLRPLVFLVLIFAVSNTGRAPRWPALVLGVQMACVYFFSGWAKLFDPYWRDGSALASILANPEWSLVAGCTEQVPPVLLQASTWAALVFELGFPLFMILPKLRTPTLLIGAAFHAGTYVTLDVGFFAVWSVVCYLPLLPWELLPVRRSSPRDATEPSATMR